MKLGREEQKQLAAQVAFEINSAGQEVFNEKLFQTRHQSIDESLKLYQECLARAYITLDCNDSRKDEMGITEEIMFDIKQTIYDLYFSEIESKLVSERLGKSVKDVFIEKLRIGKIQCGRMSFEDDFLSKTLLPKNKQSFPKLFARLADFNLDKVRKKRDGQTSGFDEFIMAGLSGLVSNAASEPFFLEKQYLDKFIVVKI